MRFILNINHKKLKKKDPNKKSKKESPFGILKSLSFN